MPVILPEFEIIPGEGSRREPVITALKTGGFVAVWQSIDTDGSSGIKAQLFDGFGKRVGSWFQVNEIMVREQSNPSVTALDDGRFMVSWDDKSFQGGDTTGTSLQARIFNTDGTSVTGTSQFLISNPLAGGTSAGGGTLTVQNQYNSHLVGGLLDGRYAVVYSEDITVKDDPVYGTYSAKQTVVRIFNSDGSRYTERVISLNAMGSTVDTDPSIVVLSDGKIAITYRESRHQDPNGFGQDVYVTVLGANGQFHFSEQANGPAGSGENQYESSIAALPNGGFVVTWYNERIGDIEAQAYHRNPTSGQIERKGLAFKINSTTADIQNKPVTVGLPDGRFVVAWVDYSTSSSNGANVKYRVFNNDTSPQSVEITIHSNLTGNQLLPDITVLTDGRFIISWVDESGVITGRGKIEDWRTKSIILEGTEKNDSYVGANAEGLGDHLSGRGGNDTLWGGSGNDILDGGSGNDTLYGDEGADKFYGDTGRDVVTYELHRYYDGETTGAVFNLNTGATGGIAQGDWFDNIEIFVGSNYNDSMTGIESDFNGVDEEYYGLSGNDVLKGGAGQDWLYGGEDQDLLDGGNGNDVLSGGAGDDTMYGGQGADRFNGGAGNDTVTYEYAGARVIIDLSNGANNEGEAVGDQFEDAEAIILSRHNDKLIGNNNANPIYGGDGNDTLIGAGGNDFLHGGNDHDDIDGGEGEDSLFGHEGNDILYGGLDTEADTLNGGGGDDTLYGGAGADTFVGELGTNYVSYARSSGPVTIDRRVSDGTANGGDAQGDRYFNINEITGSGQADRYYGLNGSGDTGWDVFYGGGGNDIIQGNNGYGQLFGNEGDDSIEGGADRDTLDGGAGKDTLRGGADNDTYYADATDLVLDTSGTNDQLYATANGKYNLVDAGIEQVTIQGGLGNVHVIASSGGTKIVGNALANTLQGGDGSDNLEGGNGSDTYIVVSGNDNVDEKGTGAGDIDLVLVSVVSAYALTANVENLKATGSSNIDLTGNDLPNEITGNGAFNVINGGIGNDTIKGGGGADRLDGGAGSDIYIIEIEADLAATINDTGSASDKDRVKTSVSYTLTTETVEELEATGIGNIDLYGNSIRNLIIGNGASNILDGKGGVDTMRGGSGSDAYYVDEAGDIVDETGSVTSSTDADVVRVKNGVNYILSSDTTVAHIERIEAQDFSGKEAMNLTGNGLSQTITGNDGANIINGGGGADTMRGRGGNDIYTVDSTDDIVEDLASSIEGSGWDKVITTVHYTLTDHVEELEASGTNALTLKGNNLGNVITGNGAANEIDGGTGADTMKGGDGSDTYIVDNSKDIIEELGGSTSGYDTVRTSASYVLSANIERLEATGADNISLTGNSIGNLIIGNSGNNTLDGAGGADILQGSFGNDIYIVDESGDVVEEIDGQSDGVDEVHTSANFTLSKGVEILRATSNQGLVLTGNSDATGNQIYGADGADKLSGGVDTAVDTLRGGSGNDVYYIDGTVRDLVQENAGEGTRDEVIASVSYTLTDNVEVLTASGTGDIDLTGNSEANTITGNTGNNSIDGGVGADVMDGQTGNDTYNIDNANDRVVEGADAGNDTIITKVNYGIDDNVHVETLKANGTADQQIDLTGNVHSNTLIGHSGANVLNGGAGADRMEGGDGDDIYYVDNVGDVVVDTSGSDTVITKFTTVLAANDAIEHLTASARAQDADGTGIDFTGNGAINKLTGNELSNKLDGGGGDDVLDGKGGADIMEGGLGDDTFYVDNLGDVVTDAGGKDIVITNHSLTLASDSPIENLRALAGIAGLTLTGNAGANKLTANDSGTVLDGGKGADTMEGGSGNDTYWIRDLTDVVLGDKGGSNDTAHLFRGLYTDAQWTTVLTDLASLGIETIIEHAGTGDNTRPTDITLTSTSIPEDARNGDVIGVLGVVDVAGGPYDYQITGDPDGKFELTIVGGEVRLSLKSGATLDRETAASHKVTVLVTDRDSGLTFDKEFTIVVDNVNEVATAITLRGGAVGDGSVNENADLNTLVGVLGNNDPDIGDTFTYAFVGGLNDGSLDPLGRFKIVQVGTEWQIQVNNPTLLDRETNGSHTVLVRVTDRAGQSIQREVTVTVNNVNEVPGDASLSGGAKGNGTVDESAEIGTVVGVLSATDPDTGNGTGLTYAIETDPTGGKFVLEGNEIKLAGAVDFEANDPNLLTEAGTGRKYYNVVVRVTDGGTPTQSSTNTVKVYVNDVNENPPPLPMLIDNRTVLEHALTNAAVGRLLTVDTTTGETFTYQLAEGGDAGGRFMIGANNILRVSNGLTIDFEQQRVWEVKLLVTSSTRGTFEQTFTISVRNRSEEEVTGSDGEDVIVSGDGFDILDGGAGDDVLQSGLGTDLLTGGRGSDTFVFDRLSFEGINTDTIVDFNIGEDRIHIVQAEFGALGNLGQLADAEFFVGEAATTAEHRIIYDSVTGKLYYDIDGVGGEAALEIAEFAIVNDLRPVLRAEHFIII